MSDVEFVKPTIEYAELSPLLIVLGVAALGDSFRAGWWPVARNTWQARVVTVKPGGTGSPRRVISARFAPLPPRMSFSSR